MPTKNQRIEALEKEVENLKEQLKFCRMAVEPKKPASVIPEAEATPETSEPTSEPETSSTETSDTKQT